MNATPAVCIPGAVVTHVLPDESAIRLAKGQLSLYIHTLPSPCSESTVTSTDDSSSSSSTSSTAFFSSQRVRLRKRPPPILTLVVGNAAFPLYHDTPFGTLKDDGRVYIFQPPIIEAEGYVKLRLPHGVMTASSQLSHARDTFEQILLDHGLLVDGLEAIGDDLGRTFKEQAVSASSRLRDATKEYLRGNPPTRHPAPVSATTHGFSAMTAAATESLYRAATLATSAIGSAAWTAGAWVTDRLTGVDSDGTREPVDTGASHVHERRKTSRHRSSGRSKTNHKPKEKSTLPSVGGNLVGVVQGVGAVTGVPLAAGVSAVGGAVGGVVERELEYERGQAS
ncbi:hypothetical protein K474DRAFT_227988 [Panus rudis PR-1116 ss-1]|nr:hypothetical protein K474DRAFT_227988 [Panus rudis PR-1116 ss-1]